MASYEIDQFVMDLEDYQFLAWTMKCPYILRALKDKRLKANRYVTEKTTKFEGSDHIHYAGIWFHVSYGKDTSIPISTWAEECERMGLRWELRQVGDYHICVFLLHSPGWLYDKQLRNRETDEDIAIIRWNSDKGYFEKIQKIWQDPSGLIELGDDSPKKWPPGEKYPNYAEKKINPGRRHRLKQNPLPEAPNSYDGYMGAFTVK